VFRQILRRLLVLSCALLPVPGLAADQWHVEGVERVVAISDVHGAYEAMVATLDRAGILDETLAWSGGNTHLVIVGDLLDRGPRSRDVLDLLMRIEGGAAAAGGLVHVLIGNHESMNMIGDLRYVSADEYASFADDETPEERDRWFLAWAERLDGDPADTTLRKEFDGRFPAGFFARRRAFGPEGEYGKWLLTKPVVVVIDGTAFVHGGLPPLVTEIGLDGVNGNLQQDLARYIRAVDTLMAAGVLLPTDNFYDHVDIVEAYLPDLDEDPVVLAAIADVKRLATSGLMTTDGPLWYRANVSCGAIIEEHRLVETLEAIDADRVVVGHTPTLTRQVLQRFNGRIIEVDTGMLNTYYKGSGNALVLEGDMMTVLNQNDIAPYAPLPHPRQVGWRADNLSAEALEQLLRWGDVVANEKDVANGRTILQISDGSHTVRALFDRRRTRGFYPDVAAYRLDLLLGLDMVPVSVVREVDGAAGSVQFYPDKSIDESQRSAAGRGSSATCPLPDQWQAMYLFDILIYNEGRSQKRMLYNTGDWSLILTEHGRAFRHDKGRPPHLTAVHLTISDGWRDALQALTNDVLAAKLDDVLDKRRIRSIATRRDELLAEKEKATARSR